MYLAGVLIRSAKIMSSEIYEKALNAATATQSSKSLPGWFIPNIIQSIDESSVVSFSIYRAWKLNANERWESQDDGSRVLVTDDPVEGKKIAIHISRPDSERIDLFKVRVDLNDNIISILESTDLDSVSIEDYCITSDIEVPWPVTK